MDDNLSGRLKNVDKIHALKLCPLFKGLSSLELIFIARKSRLLEIKRNEKVYSEGETPKAFYVIVSGRFEIYRTREGLHSILAYLKQGSYFGEVSLLTGNAHSATVEARSDSLVMEIAQEDFQNIIRAHPSVSIEMNRLLSTRMLVSGSNAALRSDVISVFGLDREFSHTAFCVNLAVSIHQETSRRTVLVDLSEAGSHVFRQLNIQKRVELSTFAALERGMDRELSENITAHESGIDILNLATQNAKGSEEVLIHLLNRLSVDYRYIVIDLPNEMNDLVLKVFSQSDELFLVTNNDMANATETRQVIHRLNDALSIPRDRIKIVIHETLLGFTPSNIIKRELFGHRDCFFLPRPESADDSLADKVAILSYPEWDYSKVIRHIARKVSKNLIGLSLGSGAALGFAHIGVLKVLEREKIPIDYIAGSSMGALMGAFYASGMNAAEMEKMATRLNRLDWLWLLGDLSLFPIRGIMRGKRIEGFIRKYLKGTLFEETRIPLLVIATNLTKREAVVMNTGLIWKAVRASIAIPGVFDPVITPEGVLIDGGVIDPLPIQPLKKVGVDKIIAIDVLPTPEDVVRKKTHNQVLAEKQDLLMQSAPWVVRQYHRMKKNMGKKVTTNLPSVIVNSIQMMEHALAETASSEADILIRPNLSLAHWIEFHKAATLIRLGEEAAEAQLKGLHNLVRQQNI